MQRDRRCVVSDSNDRPHGRDIHLIADPPVAVLIEVGEGDAAISKTPYRRAFLLLAKPGRA